MSLDFIRETVQSLKNDYGVKKLILSKYIVGAVDFKTATTNNETDSITVTGIALPKSISTMFLPKHVQFTWDKNSRVFIIETKKNLECWVKEGQYITYLDKVYNIKSSETVENIYYYVVATSAGDEDGVT